MTATETEYDAHRRRVNAPDRDAHHAAYAAEHGATALLPPWWLRVTSTDYQVDPATRVPLSETPTRGTLALAHPPLRDGGPAAMQLPVRPAEIPAGALLAVTDRMSSRVMVVRTITRLGPVSIGLAEVGEIDGGGDEMDDDWMAVTVRERPRTQTAYVEILHVDESR